MKNTAQATREREGERERDGERETEREGEKSGKKRRKLWNVYIYAGVGWFVCHTDDSRSRMRDEECKRCFSP